VTEPLSMQQMIDKWLSTKDGNGNIGGKGAITWEAQLACADEASAVLARLRELSMQAEMALLGEAGAAELRRFVDALDAILGEKK
jgi:hypothetical protein